MTEESLAAKTTSGVAWTAVQKWAVRLSGFATIAILARLLDPHDFGLVAAASTVTPLLYLLSDLGFSTYVETTETVDRRSLSTAFWFSATVGTMLSLGLVAAAPLVAALLHAPGLARVLPVMSVAVFLVAIASVPMAVLRRRMEFRRIAMQSAVSVLAAQIAAVIVALTGGGVWALVAQVLVNQALTAVLAWASARWRPDASFSRSEFLTMARFGINVVGIEFVDLARQWAETAVITSVLGVTGLGYLNIAQRLVQVAQDLTVSAVTPVTTVAFAKVRSSIERLRDGYGRVIEVTYAAAVPLSAVLAVAAPVAVPLVYGSGWSPSVLPAEAYAVASFAVVGAVVDKAFFFGVGKPGRWFVYGLVTDGVTFATTAVMVHFGLQAVAIGFVAVAFAALIARSFLVRRLISASVGHVLAPFARALAVGVAAAIAGSAVLMLVSGWPHLLALLAAGGAVATVYLALVRRALPAAAATGWSLVARVWRRRVIETSAQIGTSP